MTQKSPTPIDLEVGKRIRLRRILLGLTQQQLAAKIGVSFQQVQKYERGLNRVSASRMVPIAAALGVTPAWLMQSDTGAPAGIGPVADDPLMDTDNLLHLQSLLRLPPAQQASVRALVNTMAGG
ncbi:helix-turn-helix domain-containing protein [Novispirillum itersonii]|uniref:helix-turn-helix domain-containing protein n=1 Tax=Novispirillum itersonii TaxID=189 RepID=UPI00036005C8|nr:helix-turn-helix transcriptional regulator [Novispirillum itersonii]